MGRVEVGIPIVEEREQKWREQARHVCAPKLEQSVRQDKAGSWERAETTENEECFVPVLLLKLLFEVESECSVK